MKLSLLLPLLLLGIASALHLKNNEAQTDLSQDLKFSGEKKGELVLPEEAIPSEEEELKGSGDQDSFEDEYLGDDVDSDLADPEDFQCPKEDDTVQISGTPECKTCHYVVVKTLNTFHRANNICRQCYRGNLVSIHSNAFNSLLQSLVRGVNQGQVWIGGIYKRKVNGHHIISQQQDILFDSLQSIMASTKLVIT
ncbi:proteoglycan 3-like [Suncus etruscus]|uniref:proteoglycan 3-like n=1 Tax=Suncus etruscus TaxID=109475 RepID=UPI00210F7349|nr:proteoglycan 3-like [Suncus etruscus]